ACGDAGLAEPLLAYGVRYLGVDLSRPMVVAARRRVHGRAEIHEGDLNEFEPPAPVAATTCFRAVYYARDRLAFFRHVASFTDKKLVFDLDPRRFELEDVRSDLRAAGFDRLDLRPFFSPQRVALPRPAAAVLRAAERSGPLARFALRFRFSYLCSASRGRARSQHRLGRRLREAEADLPAELALVGGAVARRGVGGGDAHLDAEGRPGRGDDEPVGGPGADRPLASPRHAADVRLLVGALHQRPDDDGDARRREWSAAHGQPRDVDDDEPRPVAPCGELVVRAVRGRAREQAAAGLSVREDPRLRVRV